MSRVLAVVIFLIQILLSYKLAEAKPKSAANPPAGAVKLSADHIFLARGAGAKLICGGKKKYQPGKLVGRKKTFFLPLKNEVARIAKRSPTKRSQIKLEKMNIFTGLKNTVLVLIYTLSLSDKS